MVQYDNTVAFCPKILGISECVDMATVAMATELGHMSMQMLFIHLNAMKDRVQGEECQREGLSATPRKILMLISVIPLLLHTLLIIINTRGLIYHLRAPPCGCMYTVSLHVHTVWCLCTGAGLDRKPR